MQGTATPSDVFSILADRHTLNILKATYGGLPASATSYAGNLSKKQFYMRLKKLREAGLVEKNSSFYRTTTLGSLICNGQVKAMEEVLSNYWSLKAIDILKSRKDIPLQHKEAVINDLLQSTNLKNFVNFTHLNGFSIIKDFNRLISEVLKIIEYAREEIFFASRYHDPHVSTKLLEKFSKGVAIHLIDGNPEQRGLVNRLNAVLRTPPSSQTRETVIAMMRSHRFSVKSGVVPISFVVVDGRQVCYEIVGHDNPQEFTAGISSYNDPYMAQSLVRYFRALEANAEVPRLLASIRES